MVEHRGVVNFVRAFSRGLGITPEDRVLHSFSPSSDGSLSDVFSALANGACLAVAERETVLTPGALEDLIRRERVTIATLTPSMMTLLRPENLPELRTVCSVGEPISGQLAARWSAGRRLINGYGLTETSIGVSLAELPGPVSRPTIGRPLENVQVYVLDPHLEPVPIGAVGEICIGGVQVGRGYLNRPELTEARFVPDPFKPAALTTEYSVPSTQYSVLGTPYSVPSTACCDSTGSFQRSLKRCPEAHADRTSDLHSARTLASSAAARLYRTGDLGRLRADGSIELLGRSDDQVKIRGYRVEPGEIAAALEEHPEVGQAAVVLWEDRPGDGQLVAYVVLRRTAFPGRPRRPGKAVLRAHLRKRLPEHMIPGQFVVLDALPRTVQGKIDRQRLPPPPKPDFGSQDRRGPRDELETLVAAVWQEVLGVGEVGCDEDFFALGGHSLLAVRVMAEIEARTGRRLPLAALFQEATVAHLAGLLRNPAACRAESALVPLQTSGNGRPFFCIHPAGGTVFCYRALAEHLGPERPFYGIQALGVDGSQTPHTSVDDMVAHYIAAIRSVQPHGPYLLGGWSLGGNLAFETARQLSLQGEPIGLLALLDAGALYADRGPTEDDFLPMIMALFPLETNLPLEELRKLNPQEQLQFFLQRAVQAEIVADNADFRAGRHVFEVFKTSMEAILSYRQRAFAGKVTLFAAEHHGDWFGSRSDPQLGWGKWAQGGVELHRVSGGHLEMVLEPHVAALAEKLRACLRSAQVS
jgi:amino acid adenylation domain-containing protein